jgi:hypothetical protein
MISLILQTAVNAQAPTYGLCNPNSHRYSSVQGQGFPITPALSNGQVTISGEAYIVNGCRLGLRNFVYYNGGETYWFGSNRGSNDGITLSDTFVQPSAFPANFTYDLTQRPGAQANFNGINQLRLFERNRNIVIATVDLPDLPAPSGGATGTAPSAARASANPSESPMNVKSSAFQGITTFGTIASVVVGFLLL